MNRSLRSLASHSRSIQPPDCCRVRQCGIEGRKTFLVTGNSEWGPAWLGAPSVLEVLAARTMTGRADVWSMPDMRSKVANLACPVT